MDKDQGRTQMDTKEFGFHQILGRFIHDYLNQHRTLKRECHCISVKLLKSLYEDIQALSIICFVRAKHKMKTFLTLKRNPGKLAAVIIKESGREAYTFPRSYIS